MRQVIADCDIKSQAVSDNVLNIAPGYNSAMELSDRICAAREMLDINKSELARRIGVAPTTVIEWETGKKRPKVENLEKIAVVTGVSFEWLATGRGEMVYVAGAGADRASDISAVYSPVAADEVHLLRVFRSMSKMKRKALLDLIS